MSSSYLQKGPRTKEHLTALYAMQSPEEPERCQTTAAEASSRV
jgi:hypothetical protein